MRVQSLGQEDTLEEEMATHSSILTQKIPWTEASGGLQSKGWQRVGHDCVKTNSNKAGSILLPRTDLLVALALEHPSIPFL